MLENNNIKYLSDLTPGETGIITKVRGHGAFRKRITEMGFVKGQKVRVIKAAPFRDPLEYEIMGYNVSLRRSEAQLVEVVSEAELSDLPNSVFAGTKLEDRLLKVATLEGKRINVALVGNPNCGKTTLFNYATGSHERVGNYSGVTIDAKEAVLNKFGYRFNLFDLPGTYSITEYSPEELYVRDHILETKPDVVLNIIDASNLQRNLYLTTQLIDMNIKVVIALNMYDELEKQGANFDYEYFGKIVGIPIVPTVASKERGIEQLLQKIIDVYEDNDPNVRHIHINYGSMIEEGIKHIQNELRRHPSITDAYSSRYIAVKLIEKDNTTLNALSQLDNFDKIKVITNKVISGLEQEYGETSNTVITDAKYGFIDGALKETFSKKQKSGRKVRNLDDLLTHRIWGFPIFILFMWLMFQATFSIGEYPMNWIDSGISLLKDGLMGLIPEGAFRDLLIDGIIGGVGGVVVFLPNIMILFFFISLMEDTGYMARAAFIMDRLMHKIGLHGKSFIPMLMGFGCNVPAIMATRTLENRNDRILTMLITPFMSCSARLPLYVLIISAIFPKNQGLILISIYLIGVLIAVISALIMKKVFFAKKSVPFVMELPPYRIPTLKNTSLHMWHKAVQYLQKMGTIILAASIIIWALGYFPRDAHYSQNFESNIELLEKNETLDKNSKQKQIKHLEAMQESERLEQSYIGRIGHSIEPIMQPLGFDWKIGVSILSGLAAKEIVVSTMGVIYQVDKDADEHSSSLASEIQEQKHKSGKYQGEKVFTPLVAYGFMLFILVYFPCVATIAAIGRESNWKWAIFIMFYSTFIAWLLALIVHQIGILL